MPALLTTMSTPPNASTAFATIASAPSGVATEEVSADGLAPGRPDLLHDLLGRARVGACPVHRTAQVVDHDVGAACREQQRVGASHPASRTRDYGRPAVEPEHRRCLLTPVGTNQPFAC